ncbi:MAG: hypothetical protein ACFE0P_15965 [Oceanicaulis sp.]
MRRSLGIIAAVAAAGLLSACATNGTYQREYAWSFDAPAPSEIAGVSFKAFESESDAAAATLMLQMRQQTPDGPRQIRHFAPGGAIGTDAVTVPGPEVVVERSLRTLIGARYEAGVTSKRTVLYDPFVFLALYNAPAGYGAASADAVIRVHLQVVDPAGETLFDQVVGCNATERGLPRVVNLGGQALQSCLDGLIAQVDALDGFWAAFEGDRS